MQPQMQRSIPPSSRLSQNEVKPNTQRNPIPSETQHPSGSWVSYLNPACADARSQRTCCRQGTSILRTAWIESRLGERFERQYFTEAERDRTRLRVPYVQHLASRLAAKAAVIQTFAIRTDSSPPWKDIAWRNIEIQKLPHGEPTVVLRGCCQTLVVERGITKWLLSVSHTPDYAAASAIAFITAPSRDAR